MSDVTKVLDALGPKRVMRAMQQTCKKKNYTNDGWNNCFLVQAFGGKEKFDKMCGWMTPTEGIVAKLNIPSYTVESFFKQFDKAFTDTGREPKKAKRFITRINRWLNRQLQVA